MTSEGKYLNTAQVSRLIGRSEAAVRNLVLRRKIPHRRVAGRLVFIRHEVEGWIDGAEGIRPEELYKVT